MKFNGNGHGVCLTSSAVVEVLRRMDVGAEHERAPRFANIDFRIAVFRPKSESGLHAREPRKHKLPGRWTQMERRLLSTTT